MSRWNTRREQAWLTASVLLSLGGVAGVVWTSRPLLWAVITTVGSIAIPVRDIIARTRIERRYPPPLTAPPEANQDARRALREMLGFVSEDAGRGRVQIDVLQAVSLDATWWRRVQFATDAGRVERISRINNLGYAGSPYGRMNDEAFLRRKHDRNLAIASRNPFALATLSAAHDVNLLLGMTSVLPLSPDGAREYLTPPGVPDNDVSGHMVAAAGEPFATVVLFAITQLKLAESDDGPASEGAAFTDAGRFRRADARAALELVRLMAFQLGVLIAASRQTSEVKLVGQSDRRSIQVIFGEFLMRRAEEVTTADGETGFATLLKPRKVEEARKLLIERGVLPADTD